MRVELTVNGETRAVEVEPRISLLDCLRERLLLTGAHAGCEHGVCGACTVLVDDEPARACLMLAVQADGSRITTVEGLAETPDALHPMQQAFWDSHALQCGFCTSGMLISSVALLRTTPRPTAIQIRAALSGNLCRCTGYQNIVRAVQLAAELINDAHA